MKKLNYGTFLAALSLLSATSAQAVEKTVTITSTQHLEQLISEAEAPTVTSLSVITSDGSATGFQDLLTDADMDFINTKLTAVKTVDLSRAARLGTINTAVNRNDNPLMPAFGANQTIEVIYFPNNVKNIAGGCFQQAAVKEIYLPASVNGAGNVLNRFANNQNLVKIDFYQPNPTMKSVDGVVYTTDGTTLIFYPSGIETADVVVPEGVQKFQGAASMAFNKNIRTISLPSTFNTITNGREFGAAAGQPEINANLRYISVADGNTTFGSLEGMLYNIGKKEIVVCPPAYDAEELTIDGSKITQMTSSIFGNNQKIRRVILTEGFTKLDNMTFKGAGALEYIELPSTLDFIGNECFHGCGNLRVIISRNPVPPTFNIRDGQQMGNVNFRGLPEDALVGVPAGSLEYYQNSFWNRDYVEPPYTINGTQGFSAAQFKEFYAVTVTGGTAASDVAVPGTSVTVTASRPVNEGEAFVCWTSDPEVNFVNSGSKTTSFTMPESNITVTAVFAGTRDFTIIDGITPSGSAAVGSRVDIEAPSSKNGMPFSRWEVSKGNVTLDDATSVQTSFIMPDEDVEIRAIFEAAYMVTVIDGQAYIDGEPALDVRPGKTVRIVADKRQGWIFSGWTGNVSFADATASETTFEMPAEDVTITANYTEDPNSGIAGINSGRTDGIYTVYSITGVAVGEAKAENGQFALPALTPGIYILKNSLHSEKITVK